MMITIRGKQGVWNANNDNIETTAISIPKID